MSSKAVAQALVLSPKAYNVSGVVLSDQLRSLDWEARNADRAGRAADDVVTDVLAKLKVLLPARRS